MGPPKFESLLLFCNCNPEFSAKMYDLIQVEFPSTRRHWLDESSQVAH